MANMHKVIKGTVGGWPQTLEEGDVFDADKFPSWDVKRLVSIGAVKPVAPEAEESLALAELGDKELSALASRLGVVDVAKKGRKALVAEVIAKQAALPKPEPAPVEVTEQKDAE